MILTVRKDKIDMPKTVGSAKSSDKQKSGVALPEPLAKLVNAEAERKGTTRKAVVIERLWESYRTKPDEGKE